MNQDNLQLLGLFSMFFYEQIMLKRNFQFYEKLFTSYLLVYRHNFLFCEWTSRLHVSTFHNREWFFSLRTWYLLSHSLARSSAVDQEDGNQTPKRPILPRWCTLQLSWHDRTMVVTLGEGVLPVPVSWRRRILDNVSDWFHVVSAALSTCCDTRTYKTQKRSNWSLLLCYNIHRATSQTSPVGLVFFRSVYSGRHEFRP